jgi:acyl-CoA reductase-like NAD-dependent aldehyde dehydrogenase
VNSTDSIDAVLPVFVDGKQTASSSDHSLDVVDPATEAVVGLIPAGCTEDVDRAVAAARCAQAAWGARSPGERRACLVSVAGELAQHRLAIARLLTRENGKPLPEALGEVDMTIDDIHAKAELIVHFRAGKQQAGSGILSFQHRLPRGVAACIVPWNYPVFLGVENVIANIAVGNTVVWKPSEKTPLSSHYIAEHCLGGLPPGVVNLVHGDGRNCGSPLVAHDDVDVVVFVGSEETGRTIAERCGRDLKKIVLELGGKDALVIDETVDLDVASEIAVTACFGNCGQICTSSERVYVQAGVYDEFLERFVAASKNVVVGNGLSEGVDIGPLVDDLQFDKVVAQVNDAIARGATCHTGGAPLPGAGYFYPPTVLTGLDSAMILMEEETFGPVAPVMPFDTFEEAVTRVNDCRYGLGAIVLTNHAGRALSAIESINAGMLRINMTRGRAPGGTAEPFGASGLGHGHGIELLQELTREKSVHWRGTI